MVCAFGKVSRNMVENINEEFKVFRVDMKKELGKINDTQTELFNHMSNRLPPWATILGGIGIAIISAVVARSF